MNKKTAIVFLFLLFFVGLAVRLFFAFDTPYFSGDEAYFNLRQAEHIQETGKPLFEDPLSYGGRTYSFTPLFHYGLAFFSLFFPLELVGKVVPNIFACLLVFVVYAIVMQFRNNRGIALVAAGVAPFIPIYFKETFNSVSVYSLSIPLTFLLLYFFTRVIERKEYLPFIVTVVVFTFLHPTLYLPLIALLLYVVICSVEKIHLEKREIEVLLFAFFYMVWFYVLFFKEALLQHGPAIIWQNIPSEILERYFSEITILDALYQIGLVTLIVGIYVIYYGIYRTKNKQTFVYTSLVLVVTLFLWFKLVPLSVGLMLLGLTLLVLFSEFYVLFEEYLHKTRVQQHSAIFLSILVLLLIVTSLLPLHANVQETLQTTPTTEQVKGLKVIEQISPQDTLVVAPAQEGHMVTYFSRRKNIADTNFILIHDAEKRLKDIRSLYTTGSSIQAISLFNEYGASYVYFSPYAKDLYEVEEPLYISSRAFNLEAFGAGSELYKYTPHVVRS